MTAAILSAILGFAAGVAVASALPPRTFWNTGLPLIIVLIMVAILGGV
jgi:branched-subunit amino acid ABC-type transport system permease component